MDLDSLKTAIGVLAERTDSPAEYSELLQFTAALYGLPTSTLEQLVRCALADMHE
ncbi:MAG TPA: hypothetical protein VGR73_15320 [Bryobacteraceae bacterium]|nr:hypothetical protein [Bryobacteraceae bacterium]